MRFAMLLALGGCFGSCDTSKEDARFKTEMAPLVAECAALDLGKLPRAEPALAKGRKAVEIKDGKLDSPITPFGTRQSYALTRAETGLILLVKTTRDAEATFEFEGGAKGYGGWVTHAVVAYPEKQLVFMRRSWCPPSNFSIHGDTGPSCGVSTMRILDALRGGREPSMQMHEAADDKEFRKIVFEAAANPETLSRDFLEACIDFESKTDNQDTALLAKLKAALAKLDQPDDSDEAPAPPPPPAPKKARPAKQ